MRLISVASMGFCCRPVAKWWVKRRILLWWHCVVVFHRPDDDWVSDDGTWLWIGCKTCNMGCMVQTHEGKRWDERLIRHVGDRVSWWPFQ